ncbi:Piwi domain-containing protein [Triangularia verruculosa]|uniref:Piwi domain-containing protein n=1 Tax=Triangularia verruculosa TaxID=2587418 RepID=A0AAN6XTK5_9PEZI|nr:Piwi domain-containing protein [Triangularia verruculosa]
MDDQEWSLHDMPSYPQDTAYKDLNSKDVNKRIDLTPEAYILDDGNFHPFEKRPGFNQDPKARKVTVGINQWRIKTANLPTVYQYDLAASPVPDHNVVFKKIWENNTLKQHMKRYVNKDGKNAPWLYDGGKIIWSTNDIGDQAAKRQIDLREGENRGTPQNFMVTVTKTRVVNLEALNAYLSGKMGFDNVVLESLSFLDHVFRSGPTVHHGFMANKRILIHPAASEYRTLNAVTEAIKGIYSAIRLNSSNLSGGIGLGVNVDVSNNTYWLGQNMAQLARHLVTNLAPNVSPHKPEDFWDVIRPVKGPNGQWGPSAAFKVLRRMVNLRFKVTHRGKKKEDSPVYKVKSVMFDQKYGNMGATAKAVKFNRTTVDDATGKKTVTEWSVFDFYLAQYNRRITHWQLPLVETTKAGAFPMEYCEVQRFCPYPFKLDGAQTKTMLEFAVSTPKVRKQQIEAMVAKLKWGEDRFLKHFGIQMDPNMPKVEARIIPNPGISFGNKILNPGMTGRWDLRNVKLLEPNPVPLKSWGVCITQGCIDDAATSSFMRTWINIYKGHGGRVNNDPIIFRAQGNEYQEIVTNAWKTVGQKFQSNPQIIFFVLKDRGPGWYYERLKRSADCRYAMPTQMLQAGNVRKAQPQYCSNVSLKVNAKLGGCTGIATKTVAGQPLKPFSVSPHFDNQPTMFIGADVSHGAAGQLSPSIAAITVSMDKAATKYRAAAQTNGWRVEIVQPYNMIGLLRPIISKWRNVNGCFPKRVFYMRDGVSEGQYAHVLDHEFTAMKKAFQEVLGAGVPLPQFTVIIATKRHHIRFFPESNVADKNGNALPGTLVEREVTHPFQYDFYLCSHVAIKGTARPVHYTVLVDEIKMAPAKLQEMIYHQCYQYVRSTTPVSLHPAVYYAHLVSNRARPHEMKLFTDRVPDDVKHGILRAKEGQFGKKFQKKDSKSKASTDERNKVCPKLIPLGVNARAGAADTFVAGMWFV